jgi:hypothetical protein
MCGLGLSALGRRLSDFQLLPFFFFVLADILHLTEAFRDPFGFRKTGNRPKRNHGCYGGRYGDLTMHLTANSLGSP